jgi:hypothetical protein
MPIKGSKRPCQRCGSMDRYPRTKTGGGGSCVPCAKANAKRWHADKMASVEGPTYHRGKVQRARLTKFGIDPVELEALLEAQHNCCAICDRPNPTHIDHDHRTGRVRGVLCLNCNTGLGQFRDDAERLTKAAEYLRRTAGGYMGAFKDYRRGAA